MLDLEVWGLPSIFSGTLWVSNVAMDTHLFSSAKRHIHEPFSIATLKHSWKIPELNGGFDRKITYFYGPFPSKPCLIPGTQLPLCGLQQSPNPQSPGTAFNLKRQGGS